ncbi:hypothetical protein O2N63_06155 [Aliiroseovarius sp. KMU-50]|uniref:Uncharacterized protein n=1 Tax=Aliiroseovarius salicola TaxID=3009082 RepID=A0ABT4VZJ0_9RHOB|nr:hypothetical protein [Aliiroseovarius sp. KMU-50]MDA5093668.1 hypothetical protein [Aliiroseovarius sp. KMU-50]
MSTLLAKVVSAEDLCPIEVDAASFLGEYKLALGDMSIEESHSSAALNSWAFFAGANKGAIRLPLTTEIMDVRIIQGSGGQLFLGDGYQDAPLTIRYENDIYLTQNVKDFFRDLAVEENRLRAAKGLLHADDPAHDGYQSVTTGEDYRLACYPPGPTTIFAGGETASVKFSYGLAVLSHSKESTLMLGRLNWIGVNGVRATRQVVMMRGQFANMDYWFKNYFPGQ